MPRFIPYDPKQCKLVVISYAEGFDRVVNLDVERGPDNYLGFKWDSNKLKIYKDVLEIGADFQSEFKEPPLVVLSPIGVP